MTDTVLEALLQARRAGLRCALVTVAATTGSVPREPGAKMLVCADGRTIGTIGGGKFEALVVEACGSVMQARAPVLKTYPLHEGSDGSFGAICGGEVTILIEPFASEHSLHLVGAGHCARAVAELARACGWRVTVMDDREDLLATFPADEVVSDRSAAEFISEHAWLPHEALVLVSRNYQIDRDALRAALRHPEIAYLGMIGSRRKVRRVFDELRAEKVSADSLASVYAPIGLDIGADSPAEIAVAIIAEAMQVLRHHAGGHLRANASPGLRQVA
ncbi:MAG TPA: XdhC/CoxI family protein [Chthoniobacteraceae bacterium]|nr:XdhC/CoxI family protein [Chthoniobacteraceae bacterium]